MKYALSCANGEIKYNLTKKELINHLIRETVSIKNDDILVVYPMIYGSNILLGTDILAVHLCDGELNVHGVKECVFSKSFSDMLVADYYNAISKALVEAEKNSNTIECRFNEQVQFEQAEAEKAIALYSLSIGNNNFRYKGEYASDCIYSVIQGFFSSLSRDEGVITIRDLNKGDEHTIEYSKGLAKASVKIDGGQYKTFDYCYPTQNCELQNFIKKEVIL